LSLLTVAAEAVDVKYRGWLGIWPRAAVHAVQTVSEFVTVEAQLVNIALRIEDTLSRLGGSHSKPVDSVLNFSWRALSRTTPISASENPSDVSTIILSAGIQRHMPVPS
jgi:hypothetical protein